MQLAIPKVIRSNSRRSGRRQSQERNSEDLKFPANRADMTISLIMPDRYDDPALRLTVNKDSERVICVQSHGN